MKLKIFNKNEKQKRIIIGSILGILVVIGSIVLIRSYALYEEEKEFNVLKGQIPDFGYDIKMLSVVVDGEPSTIPIKPEIGSYLVDVTCDKGVGEWDYKNWKLSLSEFEKETKCRISFTTSSEEEITNNDFERPTFVTLNAMTISSSSGVLIPTYNAKFIKIDCSTSIKNLRVDGRNSNLGQYIMPYSSNGIENAILFSNAKGIKVDVSSYSYVVIYYNVSSSSTTIKDVTVEWFYE